MEPATKRVLVHFRGRTRPVEFAASQSDSESDSEVLLKEIVKTFSDQFSRGEDANPDVFLQIQDEEWSGEYVDVGNSQPIPNKSVIRMVVQDVGQSSAHEMENDPVGTSCQQRSQESLDIGRTQSRQLRLSVSGEGISLVKETARPDNLRDSGVDQYIREQAQFYGRDPSKPLTPFQVKVNSAAEELAIATPGLLQKRQKLLELARAKVDDDGFMYKKGKSRSKRHGGAQLDESESCKQPKRPRTNETVRVERMLHLEEVIKDTNKQIHFKELRREQASNSHKYQLCESISEEISELKLKRYQMETELKLLKRKQQQSTWYRNKMAKHQQHSESDASIQSSSVSEQESSTTVYPNSSTSDQSALEFTPPAVSSPKPFFSTTPSKQSSTPTSPFNASSPQPLLSTPLLPSRQSSTPVSSPPPIQLSSSSDTDGESHFP